MALSYLACLFGIEKPFVVVVPSYNNSSFYKRNLDSIFSQNYGNFRVIYIDDASTDGTGELVRRYIEQAGLNNRIALIQNRKRVGALANKYKGAWLCAPDEIYVDLDGDDWFAHEDVLQRLNQEYANPEVWVTYGQFIYYPSGAPGWAAQVPEEVIVSNSFREYTWVTTALRTFYAGLFQKIKRKDLLHEGAFFPMAGDLAFMFPVVEMAGSHSRFIPDILYVYNVTTMIHDVVTDPEYQKQLGWLIRERQRYEPISNLFE